MPFIRIRIVSFGWLVGWFRSCSFLWVSIIAIQRDRCDSVVLGWMKNSCDCCCSVHYNTMSQWRLIEQHPAGSLLGYNGIKSSGGANKLRHALYGGPVLVMYKQKLCAGGLLLLLSQASPIAVSPTARLCLTLVLLLLLSPAPGHSLILSLGGANTKVELCQAQGAPVVSKFKLKQTILRWDYNWRLMNGQPFS